MIELHIIYTYTCYRTPTPPDLMMGFHLSQVDDSSTDTAPRLFSRHRLVKWTPDSKRTVVTWLKCIFLSFLGEGTVSWLSWFVGGSEGEWDWVLIYIYTHKIHVCLFHSLEQVVLHVKHLFCGFCPPFFCDFNFSQVMISHQWSASGHPDPKMRQTVATWRGV